MPRTRRRRGPVNDPGGLETIFENTDDENESPDVEISPVKKFVLGICARRRSLVPAEPWALTRDKARQRKKMLKKYGQKPLELQVLSPGREANLNQLLEERISEPEDVEIKPEDVEIKPQDAEVHKPQDAEMHKPQDAEMHKPQDAEIHKPQNAEIPLKTQGAEIPLKTQGAEMLIKAQDVPAAILKELEEADAICGPIPFLLEQPPEARRPRKKSTVIVRRSSRFMANKENLAIGTVFQETEVIAKKTHHRRRSSSVAC